MDIVVEKAFGTLRTESTATRPSCWTPPTQTHKRRYTCGEAALITMDELPLLLWRASVNIALARGVCPMTNGATKLPLQRWKAMSASE